MDSIMATDYRHLKSRFLSLSCPRGLLVASKTNTTCSKTKPQKPGLKEEYLLYQTVKCRKKCSVYFTVCPLPYHKMSQKEESHQFLCAITYLVYTSTIKVRTTYRCFSLSEQDYYIDLVLRLVFSEHMSDCEDKSDLCLIFDQVSIFDQGKTSRN